MIKQLFTMINLRITSLKQWIFANQFLEMKLASDKVMLEIFFKPENWPFQCNLTEIKWACNVSNLLRWASNGQVILPLIWLPVKFMLQRYDHGSSPNLPWRPHKTKNMQPKCQNNDIAPAGKERRSKSHYLCKLQSFKNTNTFDTSKNSKASPRPDE